MVLIDIVVPVYDGFDDTQNCLISLNESLKHNEIHCNVIVINDQSPNQTLTDWLRSYCIENQFQLLENETNLGFVATVNKGMSVNSNTDVILLNSDTIVANNWVDRMVDCAYSTSEAGTVTPVSNHATICSFPHFCRKNPVPRIDISKLDKIFSSVNYGCSLEIPTGIGFCMLIKRACLNETGFFNEEAFGKGYGEENDFCMRAVGKGWKNLFCLDTFVAHVGDVSFSSKKIKLIENASVVMENLHPGYHQLILDHMQEDPAKIFRVRSYLGILQESTLPNILLLSHNLGGGVETHLHELKKYNHDRVNFLTLKRAGQTYLLSIGDLDQQLQFELPNQYQDLLYLLNMIGLSKVHFHHLIDLDPILRNLGQDLGVAMDFTVHDYYLVNGNPTLTDKSGLFCADPETRDELCGEVYPVPSNGRPEDWRNEVLEFLNNCQRIIIPSLSTAEIFQSYFPDINSIVAYHPGSEFAEYPNPTNWAPEKKTLKILTLGAISQIKGAALLEETAIIAHEKGVELEFHLLGYADRPLRGCIKAYGNYQASDLVWKLEEIKPDLVWLPSLCPETYSYTLSESLLAGIPVVVPDIGAFPERVSGRPSALVYKWNSSPKQMIDIFSKLRAEGPPLKADEFHCRISDKPVENFYRDQYLSDLTPSTKPAAFSLSNEWLASYLVLKSMDKHLTYSERFLVKIYHFRQSVAGRVIRQMIPIQFQRKLKHWLSQEPIHELTS